MHLRKLFGLSSNSQQSPSRHRGIMLNDTDTIAGEMLSIAGKLESLKPKLNSPEIKIPLEKLEKAASNIGRSWSGSWMGYQSRIYYHNFQPPPPGARFSQEWGLLQ